MKFKHYKFPPQNYPPRISFKLMIKSELMMTDAATSSLNHSIPIALGELVTDQADMIDTSQKQDGTTTIE